MAYRTATLSWTVADDSSLGQIEFQRQATFYQTKDLKTFSAQYRVQAADTQTQITIPTITTPYSFAIFSDYPVMVRLTGASGDLFTMVTNNVTPTNVGAPLPDQCFLAGTIKITGIWLTPIASAAQTANVRISVTGDPVNAYT